MTLAALLACCLAAMPSATGAATVTYRNLVLHAVGGFQPQSLPRRAFAPISFEGEVSFSTRDGAGRPPALTEAVIAFDRDGRLDVTGLPTCTVARVATLGTSEARAACRGAMVGQGLVEALVEPAPGAAPVLISSPLSIFNGPDEAGHPTAVLHANLGAPANQTFAITAPIERTRGQFRYRVTLHLPPIAGGLGSLTRIRVKIGRRFQAGGQSRSYVAAHCRDSIVRTRGRFSFADGTIIDGFVEKFCRATG
ncbi:MAG: hypothetical protein JST31_04045 [Actinobacteria bacterium]|nr:hypothetical protein [Actinomycetota bacterium]